MFTENERSYFEQMLDAKFDTIQSKLDHIHSDVRKTNGRVNKLEEDVEILNSWMAMSRGHWKGVNRVLAIGLTIIGIIVGAIATMLWH